MGHLFRHFIYLDIGKGISGIIIVGPEIINKSLLWHQKLINLVRTVLVEEFLVWFLP
jgi:hypothetical protein